MAEDHHNDDTSIPGSQWQYLVIGFMIVAGMAAAICSL